MKTIGNFAPDFEIPGIDQKVYHLGSYCRKFKAIAVVFMDNNSTDVERYIERLKQIQTDFGDRGFTLMGIDSNHTPYSINESIKAMQKYAQEKNLNFPYLRDPTQDVAKSFKAKVTPSVYLLDSDAVIRYQGRIDDCDDCAESIDQVTNHYLRDSISAMLSGKKIAKDYTEPSGTPIQWQPKP
ncbi:MAG: redoxin domain-containing protein [Pleurocapsa sp. MO_192.B19]|nr:redoxin domain-containing protein [Pleurocapsa sp. MO_192.B19]